MFGGLGERAGHGVTRETRQGVSHLVTLVAHRWPL